MGKQKHRPVPAWMTGRIPWTAADLRDVIEYIGRLKELPVDQWEMPPDEFFDGIMEGEDEVSAMLSYQLMAYVRRRHRARYGDRHHWECLANLLRANAALRLITHHGERLEAAGLMSGADHWFELAPALLEALAKLPFSAAADDEEPCEFDLDEVVNSAQAVEGVRGSS
jgi:hypothetical protein